MSRATIKDIARRLGVHPSTVSRALKDHPDISEKTKQAVRKMAKELDYRPNVQAIHFRNRKSGLIGLIIPELGEFFLPSVISAIEEVTREQGYNLMVFQSNNYLEREKEIIQICQGFKVDGLLFSLSHETRQVQHLKELTKEEVPVVIFDRMLEDRTIPTVGIYDQQAARRAVEHLIEKGYRHIGGVFGNPNLTITQQRFAGFRAALENAGRPLDESLVSYAGDRREARDAMQRLAGLPTPPDAVFAMSDECLVGMIQAVYKHHIKVPEEIALIAISDGDVPYYLTPRITHILHSGYEVGKRAAELLLDLMREKTAVPASTRVRVETKLVVLESV